MARETEIKLRISDVPAFHRALKRIGARLAGPGTSKVHEENVIFDTPQGGLAKHGQLLRIRTETPQVRGSSKVTGPKQRVVLTFKQPLAQPAFRYEKYRTTFRMPDSKAWAKGLLIELDETPIGTFVELEGPAAAIDQAAAELGFSKHDYVLKNYLRLYMEDCRRKGQEPRHMVFPNRKSAYQ